VARTVGAIIVAAGSSRRMAGTDKLWIELGGWPLLARTIAAIAAHASIGQVVVVSSRDTLDRVEPLRGVAPWTCVSQWVLGGDTRQDSVYQGLQTLQPCDMVLVHDGARPLVRCDVIERGIAAASEHGAAIAAVPVTDTVKLIDADERIVATPDRAALRAAQTPQVFSWPIIHEAYARVGAARAECTDDAAVLELAGIPVYTFPGDATNIKVSTPADVSVVRSLWNATSAEDS
jgi:2-C-methyl-D-erythritol 4-phosphate cytidylyltransferase